MEKRSQVRVACEIEGHFKSLAAVPTPGAGIHAVRDVSEGGLRFRSNRFIPMKQRLLIQLSLPNSVPIESWAEVAWIRELPHLNCYEAGAKLVDFPLPYKNLLHNFVFQKLLTV